MKPYKEPLLYRTLAKLLTKPFIRERLIGFAQDKPLPPRWNTTSEPFVLQTRRWWLVPRFALTSTAGRLSPKPWWPFRWQIQQLLLPESAEFYSNLHAGQTSFVLDGWYDELSPDPNCRFASAKVFGELEFGRKTRLGEGEVRVYPGGYLGKVEEVSSPTRLHYLCSVLRTDGVWVLVSLPKEPQPRVFLVEGRIVEVSSHYGSVTLQKGKRGREMMNEQPDALDAERRAVNRISHFKVNRLNRIYIAGPMTGLPDYNFPAFNSAAAQLTELGWHVENPADHGEVEGAEWADYLRYDLSRMMTCGAIYLLPGWENSRGAQLEAYIAKELGFVFHYAEVLPLPSTPILTPCTESRP